MKRGPKPLPQQALLITPSEARAEAAYLMVQLIIEQVSASQRTRLLGAALEKMEGLGVPKIEDEVHALFSGFDSESPPR